MERKILLDDEAQKLFEQLGGIDSEWSAGTGKGSDLSEVMLEEENRRDEWRSLLVEIVYFLSGYLVGVRRSGMTAKYREELESLLAILDKVSAMPGHDGEMLIRYRGGSFDQVQTRMAPRESGGYVISLGHHAVDISAGKAMANRRGVIFSHLPGRFASACSAMASLELHTLHLDLRDWGATRPLLKQSLEILGRYFMVLAGTAKESPGDQVPAIMHNENDQPDPNLTLVAGLNGLSRKTLGDLVAKINGMMSKPEMEQFTSVYGALFAFRQVREKWSKPPLEVNNLRWLIADRDDEVLTREKSHLVRRIVERADSLAGVSQTIQGVYGSDYRELEADQLEDRLRRVGDFLESVGTGEEASRIEKEVLRNVERRLDCVSDEMFDRLIIRGDTLERKTGEGETITSRLNSKLAELLSFFKCRTSTKKKMKEMVRGPIAFTEQDYETIARDFGISVEEVRSLLELLKNCFGSDGRFLRSAFEKNIPDFARHEKVFALLWNYLREIGHRKDRVAYLNSLQALVSYMENPYESMLFLLGDLLRSPEALEYSDRNTMMLANAFLQRTLGEHDYDSEMTPEEVLQADDRINRPLGDRILDYLEKDRDRLYQKIRTTHEMLLGALSSEKSKPSPIGFRFLFALERELYIFLSIIGGDVGHTVVRSAVREYGEAGSEAYCAPGSARYAKELILLLQVAVRGLSRFKDESDLPSLYRILEQQSLFLEFAKKGSAESMVKRLIGWIDTARKEIRNPSANQG